VPIRSPEQIGAIVAGIFLVFVAQRPEHRVMPVQLRDNLGDRASVFSRLPSDAKGNRGLSGWKA
jgi:hypothetical protein